MDAEERLDFRDASVAIREAIDFLKSHKERSVGEKIRIGCLTRLELTPQTDFGKAWMGSACSRNYWNKVESVRSRKDFLQCFCEELRRFSGDAAAVQSLWRCLLGGEDCYRLILEHHSPHLYSYNMRGNLSWGKRLKSPKYLESVEIEDDCEEGCQVRFAFFDTGWFLLGKLQGDILEVDLAGKPRALCSYHFNSFPRSWEGKCQ